MNSNKLFNRICISVAVVVLSVTCYYSMGFAEFEREEDFGRDLRITLPDHVVVNKQVTSIYDGDDESGQFLYDSLAYSVLLKAPLPDKSFRIITSERRGWEHVDDDTYSLSRGILSESLECTFHVENNVMNISYLYDFDSFGLVIYPILMCMALAIIYGIMLIILSLIRFVRSRFV